ncbi:MAG: CBS domain-containing protein [Caldithrix sp.]|nr:CBS domain-containing protein [Caldithrix sp.]
MTIKIQRIKRQFNRIRLYYLHLLIRAFGRLRRAEHIFMVLAAIAIGILGAFGAILFRFLIKLIHHTSFQIDAYSLEWIAALPWWQKLLVPTVGGLIVGPIVHFIAREVRGSGIPEVMESVAIRGGSIRPRVVLAKAAAAAITIGSGGSAGREGPIVQIGSAIGSALGQFLNVSVRRLRTFVACGAAAGIAATFNAPIAGALFAVEVIVGDFALSYFSPIVISSVIATVISRHYIGDLPAFDVPAYHFVHPMELIPYSILGILAGLLAVFFIVSVYKSQEWFDKIKHIPPYLQPAIGGLIVGGIALLFPQVYGVGYESINEALWGRDVRWLLAVLILAKIVATSATLGSGGSGGIFAPSLFIGAMLGSLIGKEAHLLYPDITAEAGAYALVGMGAVAAGATHAPITSILIIFELTNDYHIIPPLMVSCIVSVLIATYLKQESMYTMKLVRRGINIFEGKDINVLRSLSVRDILKTDIERIPFNYSFHNIIRAMMKSQHQEYFVIDHDERLIGIVSMLELKEFLHDEDYLSELVIASDLAQPPPARLYPDDNLDLVMHQFGRYNVDELPVLQSRDSQRVIGSVQRKDVIDAYNREIFKWDLAGGVHSVVSAVDGDREVELSENYRIVELEAPAHFVGKTIRGLSIRKRYNVEIILIKNRMDDGKGIANRPGVVPGADYVIQSGDKLLVLGAIDDIRHLRGA